MTPDGDLLRRYAETGDEAAFAELVRRQLGLVYGAALRQTDGDAHRAQEVAQAVFCDVARKAGALASHPAVASWLHTSTRFAAAKLRRAEVRRWKHEQEAGAMSAERDAAAEWDRLRPVIDEAVSALDERDRETVLQRFFANRGFAEIGAALGVSEDAARMRVERALEKLRGLLARRGVTSTMVALGVALEAHAGTTVPAGLASALAGQAAAGGASAAGTTTLAETLGLMSTMKLAGGVAAGLLLAAALGTAVYSKKHYAESEERLAAERIAAAKVADELQAARERAQAAERDVTDLKQALALSRAAAAKADGTAAPAATKPTGETNRWADAQAAGDALMAKYPAVRAALGDYARARARFRYRELYEKLGLTPEKIARFEELAAYPGMGAPGPGGSEIQLIWNPEARGGQTPELAELLGSEGMKLFWALESRNESRDFVVHMAGALWSTPTPLTPAVADRLVEIIQTSQPGSGPMASSRVDWAAVIARAREFLSAPQLAVLEAEQAHAEAEAALNRAMSPLAKKTTSP